MVELMRSGRGDQVARSVQRGKSHLDQSLIATRTTVIHAPRQISNTRVTLHLRPKQFHILQKLETHGFVKEQACKKHRVRSSIFRQHRTSKWQPRGEGCSPQSCFVFRYDPLYTFHRYVRFRAQRKLAQKKAVTMHVDLLQRKTWGTMGMEAEALWKTEYHDYIYNLWSWFDYTATRVSHSSACPCLCSLPDWFYIQKSLLTCTGFYGTEIKVQIQATYTKLEQP